MTITRTAPAAYQVRSNGQILSTHRGYHEAKRAARYFRVHGADAELPARLQRTN